MLRATALGVLAALCLLCLAADADAPHWRARRRQGVLPSRRASELVGAHEWPAEPASPSQIDVEQLAKALRTLCGFMPPRRPSQYAQWLVHHAGAHGEDPFLLGALMYRMSRCQPDGATAEGVGLTSIQPSMFRGNVRGRVLRYPIQNGHGLELREKMLSHGMLDTTIQRAEANIEWAAAILGMFREQHALIDERFEQVAHRHHISHFIWGDRVKSARAEDRILTDRRRLLTYYGATVARPSQVWRGITWVSPLDGGLRVVSGVPGDPRDAGERVHRGVDLESSFGEPVYSMADGVVSFAGVDLPGVAQNAQLSPAEIAAVPRAALGRGGRFVCVTHAGQGERFLRSCYMHLEDVSVVQGQRVRAGDAVGTVGRTGMKSSAPHLHLELRTDAELFDARAIFDQLFLGDPPPPPRKRHRRRVREPS